MGREFEANLNSPNSPLLLAVLFNSRLDLSESIGKWPLRVGAARPCRDYLTTPHPLRDLREEGGFRQSTGLADRAA